MMLEEERLRRDIRTGVVIDARTACPNTGGRATHPAASSDQGSSGCRRTSRGQKSSRLARCCGGHLGPFDDDDFNSTKTEKIRGARADHAAAANHHLHGHLALQQRIDCFQVIFNPDSSFVQAPRHKRILASEGVLVPKLAISTEIDHNLF
jgi:hypothetical protein